MIESIIGALVLTIIGYTIGSVRIIEQGEAALVQRFGKFHRVLQPGMNFVIPVLDKVIPESLREQTLDIDPKPALTRDNVPIEVDAIVFWKILDPERAYYAVEDLDVALENLVVTSLFSEIGRLELRETTSARDKINEALLRQLDEATANWGVKVLRVEIQNIKLSDSMRESLEQERAAESRKRATLSETEGTVRSIQQLANALQGHPNAQAVLQYLVAQKYVDANLQLGQSDNSKIIFMNPAALNEAINNLMDMNTVPDSHNHNDYGNGNDLP